MRALVTGSTGFVGSQVASALVAEGHEVHGLGRSAAAPVPGMAGSFELDLRDREGLTRAVSGCDVVFHVGALYSYRRSELVQMRQINVDATGHLLAACRQAGIGRLVLTSTAATCGPVPGRPADEQDHPSAWELTVPYKQTKWEAEQAALVAASVGLDVVVVNPGTVVGPGDRRPTPSGKMVQDVVHRRMWGYLPGMGLSIVDVQDVAAGHLLAQARGRSGERYILGGENVALRDIFAIVAACAEVPPPRVAVPYPLAVACASTIAALERIRGREGSLLNLDEVRLARLPQFFSSAKAQRELGYRFRSAEAALERAARWFRARESHPPMRLLSPRRAHASG